MDTGPQTLDEYRAAYQTVQQTVNREVSIEIFSTVGVRNIQ